MLQRLFCTGCIRPGSFRGHGSGCHHGWTRPQRPTRRREAAKEEVRAVHCLPRENPPTSNYPRLSPCPGPPTMSPGLSQPGPREKRNVWEGQGADGGQGPQGQACADKGLLPASRGRATGLSSSCRGAKRRIYNTNWEPPQNALQGHLEPFLVH